MRFPAVLLFLIGCSACGSLAENTLSSGVTSELFARAAPTSAPAVSADPRAGLTRDALDDSDFELILLALVEQDLVATAQFASRNGDKETWITVDGVSVTFKSGIIVGTRGLGDDLMGADVSGLQAELAGDGGAFLRINDYLDGVDQIQRMRFQCTIEARGPETITIVERVYATEYFVEICVSQSHEFENQYWLQNDGVILQSRQWISPVIGYLDHQTL